ncbi:MAG: rhamnose/proton symporter RhaT [Planctomycetes bacterium]|nr:rhamnose/proton symporter RhaT [Planctomycetota bacterium]
MELMLPVIIVIVASFFQGTFGLGMKYVKPMAWEAWWLVHATVAMVIFPLIWCLMVVPDLCSVLSNAPTNELITGSLLGFLWGIGGIMFGISVGYIGMSLTYGIVMGLCSIVGALIPLFIRFDSVEPSSLPFIFGGLILLAVAVVIITIAGLKRDKLLAEGGKELQGIKKGKAFRTGLVIATVCGVLSSMLAIGFDNTVEIGKLAAQAGALERNTALARWVVVLAGAYLMNAGYAMILLIKNKSFSSFKTAGMNKALKWSIIAGLLWFAALGTYGQGVALMGEMGTMICWPMMLGLSLIVSNAFAVITGEWKGMGGPLKLMSLGVFVIIAATALMAYASTMKAA